MTPYCKILNGDCREVLKTLADSSVQCCVTSPPYFGLRNYGVDGQIGLEQTPDAYVAEMVAVFDEVRRVLTDDGTLWLNLGDSYANDAKWGGSSGGKHVTALHGNTSIGRGKKSTGLKAKDLIGIPWRVAFALQAVGWYLRQDIIWAKPNPMPESVTDRCTKSHEYIFLLSKSPRYFYDAIAIQEPASGWNGSVFDDGKNMVVHPNVGTNRSVDKSEYKAATMPRQSPQGYTKRPNGTACADDAQTRNKRDVWTVSTQPYREAHFATFPPDLVKHCIMAGTKPGDTVLDPFGGSGTTGMVAVELGRKAILIELNPEYVKLSEQRTRVTGGLAL